MLVIYTIFFTIGDFPIQLSIYASCRIREACAGTDLESPKLIRTSLSCHGQTLPPHYDYAFVTASVNMEEQVWRPRFSMKELYHLAIQFGV